MEGASGATRSIMDEVNSWEIQRVQMEGESGVTRSVIDELLLWISNEIKPKVKVVLPELSFMNFILWIFK